MEQKIIMYDARIQAISECRNSTKNVKVNRHMDTVSCGQQHYSSNNIK